MEIVRLNSLDFVVAIVKPLQFAMSFNPDYKISKGIQFHVFLVSFHRIIQSFVRTIWTPKTFVRLLFQFFFLMVVC